VSARKSTVRATQEPDKMRVVAGMDDERLWVVPFWYIDVAA
jgi:hypothetical protein